MNKQELLRYSRHFLLPEVGMEGQKKLKASSVLLVGVGGLGSPLALYLAAAGVGRIGLIDFDTVSESNLQRQVLFSTHKIGEPKVAAARERLLELNPLIEIEAYNEKLTAQNALRFFSGFDLVADGADNFSTRYLVNDAAVLAGKPLVSASIVGFEGQLSVFNFKGGPCYRCLYAEPPPEGTVLSCAENGVLGVLPGVMGCLQATEVLKILLGQGEVLHQEMLYFDALRMDFQKLKIRRNPGCALCGENPSIREVKETVIACASVEGEIGVQELSDNKEKYFFLDVREPFEAAAGKIEGSVLIPLGELKARLGEIPRNQSVVAYCRGGTRSQAAVKILKENGFAAKSLKGGILAWSKEIDSRVKVE